MEALGRVLDLSCGIAPYDSNAGAGTGKRFNMKGVGALTIVAFKGAGVAGDDPTFTLQQHTASTAGTTATWAVIDHYYLKNATALDGSEAWTKVTQVAAGTIADPGGAGTSAESQQILVIEVDGAQLSDGYGWVSLNCADTGAGGAQYLAVLYIPHELNVQRAPANLPGRLT